MFDLSKFKAFNFNEGAPYMTISKTGVSFNKGVLMKLDYPKFVVLYINDDDKQILLQSCDESTENATLFFRDAKKSNNTFVRWNGKDLINTITDMMGWDMDLSPYRTLGSLVDNGNAMFFDLTKFEILKK